MGELARPEKRIALQKRAGIVRRKSFDYYRPLRSYESIVEDLKECGLGYFGLRSGSVRMLPSIIEADERIGGAVYGRSASGPVLLLATDRRVVLVDKKFLFTKCEDVSYDIVAGETLEWLGPTGIVTLHTRMEDIKLHTTNKRAATTFQRYIEHRSIEHTNMTGDGDDRS